MTSITGIVIHGRGYEHKAPTANVKLEEPLEPGIFTAMVRLKGEVIGQAMVWSIPRSSILEVYIAKFNGNLYGEELTIFHIHRLERSTLCTLLDQALRSVPLTETGVPCSAPEPEWAPPVPSQ